MTTREEQGGSVTKIRTLIQPMPMKEENTLTLISIFIKDALSANSG